MISILVIRRYYIALFSIVTLIAFLVSGCIQVKMKDETRGTGLTRSSYGGLNKNRPNVFVSQCKDPGLTASSQPVDGSDVLAQKMTNSLMGSSPMKALGDALGSIGDETLQKEDLERFFTYSKGMNWPYVRVIHRDFDSIDFWFDGTFLRFEEADAAAQEYCGHWKKTAIFDGYAEKCGKQRWSPFVNKNTRERIMATDEDVIVAYSCKGKDTKELPKEQQLHVKKQKAQTDFCTIRTIRLRGLCQFLRLL
jgi:hypothetical protein